MRKFLSIIPILALLLCSQALAQAPATARIHHTAYNAGGALVSGYTVTLVRATKNGLTLSGLPKSCRTNSSGVLLDSDGTTQGCSVIQGAVVWISTNGAPFNSNGSSGLAVTIPTTFNAATTNAAGYAIGATTITLASAGTGAITAGDVITFAGDTNRYTVATGDTDVSNGGTIVLAAPGLLTTLTASTKAITPTVNLNDLAQLSTVLTELGDSLGTAAGGIPVRIPGNTLSTPTFLGQVGNGTTSNLPAWWTITGAGVTANPATKQLTISGGGGGSTTTAFYYDTAASYARTAGIGYISADATSAAQAVDLGVTDGIPVEVYKSDTSANGVTITYGAATLTLQYAGSWAKFIPNGSSWVLWSLDPTSGGVAAAAGYVYFTTATYAVPSGIGYVDADATAQAQAVTLGTPNASAVEVRKSDTTTNAVTITYNASTLVLNSGGQAAKFVPYHNGTTTVWVLLSRTL